MFDSAALDRLFVPWWCSSCWVPLWFVPGAQYRRCHQCGTLNYWQGGARREN